MGSNNPIPYSLPREQGWYCWWKRSCTTWDEKNLVNNGIIYLSTGAGFLPSTVALQFALNDGCGSKRCVVNLLGSNLEEFSKHTMAISFATCVGSAVVQKLLNFYSNFQSNRIHSKILPLDIILDGFCQKNFGWRNQSSYLKLISFPCPSAFISSRLLSSLCHFNISSWIYDHPDPPMFQDESTSNSTRFCTVWSFPHQDSYVFFPAGFPPRSTLSFVDFISLCA